MLSNETLNLAKSIFNSLKSGTFEGWRELVADNQNEFFIDGFVSGKALLIENNKGSLELVRINNYLHNAKVSFNAPCYIIGNNGELFNIKQKEGFEPVVSKIKDSLKVEFANLVQLDEKLIELLTNTKSLPKLEFVKVSEGYNLDGLPHSCQSGKGYRFRALDDMAKLALLKIGSRIAARCIVWNSGEIFDDKDKGEYLNNRYADKLYYGDSTDRIAFVDALEAEGIKLLWGDLNTRLTPETGDYCIKAPDGLKNMAWLDTFSMLKDDFLYCYDWSNGGYSDDTLNELASEYGYKRAFLNVDTLGGTQLEDVSNKVYSGYFGEYIDRENAVYSNSREDWLDKNDAVYSNFQDDYLVSDYAYYSSIENDYIDESTYEHSTQIASIVDMGSEWVRTDNPDYVPYKGDMFRRIALEDSIYIEAEDWYVKADEATPIDEIDEYVPVSWSDKDLKDYLADRLGSYSEQEIDKLVVKYGF